MDVFVISLLCVVIRFVFVEGVEFHPKNVIGAFLPQVESPPGAPRARGGFIPVSAGLSEAGVSSEAFD